jgi:hypothetical protein
MNYEVLSIPLFDKQTKRLAKKYSSLRADLASLIDELSLDPNIGTALGNGFYKIRLAISSKRTGKSGGARVITYVKISMGRVYLSSIYDKSEKSTISDKDLDAIFKQLP